MLNNHNRNFSISFYSYFRTDPELCLAPWKKSRPIWVGNLCERTLQGKYMHPDAPRCQTKYLHWACNMSSLGNKKKCNISYYLIVYIIWLSPNYFHSSKDIRLEDSRKNQFQIFEADHSTWNPPPEPFLIIATNSTVTICGQIIRK